LPVNRIYDKILMINIRIIYTISIILIFGYCQLSAQIPVITNIENRFGTVNQSILITGNGFSNDVSNLSVFFGGAEGNILSSSTTAIEVQVPAGTTTQSIQVVNKSNGLSAYSRSLFYISFSGSGFNPASMGSEIQFNNANEYFDLCLCDFNQNGKLDVATTQVEPGTDIVIYQNNSTINNINFSKLNQTTNAELNVNSATSNVTCGDLDGDGLIDMVISKSGNPRNVVYVFRNISSSGNIQFAGPLSLFLDTEDIAKRVTIRDLDLDGKPEIIVTNTFLPNIQIYKNNSTSGNINFNPNPIKIDISGAGTTNGLIVEDLNGDRLPDIATNPFIAGNVYFLVNRSSTGTISFYDPKQVTVTGNLNNLAAGDFNADGKIDLVSTRTIQNEIVVLVNNTPNNSDSIQVQIQTYTGDDGSWGVNTVDMDGDGRIDIIVGNRDIPQVTVFRNSGFGNTVNFNKYTLNTNLNTRNIKGGDIDGDGKPDMVFTSFDINISQFSLSVIRNQHCFIPRVEPAGPLTICSGETKTLWTDICIGGSYQWDLDNVVIKTGPENFLDINTTGVYKVVVTSESGGCVIVSNAVIVQPGTGSAPADPVIYNDGPFCEGSEIRLSTDDINNAFYSWTGPNGFSSMNRDVSIPDARPEMAGSYSLVVTVLDCSSNPASTIVGITSLPDFPISSSGPTDICEGDSVQLSVNNLAGYTFQWYRDSLLVNGATASMLDAGDEGTYNVVITQTSSSCSKWASDNVDVKVFTYPVVLFSSPATGCIIEMNEFSNSSIWDPDGVPTFGWDFGDGSSVQTTFDASHVYGAAGSYDVTLTIGYTSVNCPSSLIKTIEIYDEPDFQIVRSIIGGEQLCEGETVSLTTLPEFETYLWNTGEITPWIEITTSGVYIVTVTDSNNCTSTRSDLVNFLELPEIIATSEKDEVEPGVEFQLEAQGALTYVWSPGNVLNDPASATPLASILQATEFIVTGEDANGCLGSDTVFVSVIGENIIFVEPRKVFSPNGDGIDDFWVIENIERYTDNTIIIFTGNGSTVYEASPYNNNWDAVYNGKNLPEGAYFFIIQVKNKDPKTGSVTVIR